MHQADVCVLWLQGGKQKKYISLKPCTSGKPFHTSKCATLTHTAVVTRSAVWVCTWPCGRCAVSAWPHPSLSDAGSVDRRNSFLNFCRVQSVMRQTYHVFRNGIRRCRWSRLPWAGAGGELWPWGDSFWFIYVSSSLCGYGSTAVRAGYLGRQWKISTIRLLDGLPWHLVQIFMVPREWTLILWSIPRLSSRVTNGYTGNAHLSKFKLVPLHLIAAKLCDAFEIKLQIIHIFADHFPMHATLNIIIVW